MPPFPARHPDRPVRHLTFIINPVAGSSCQRRKRWAARIAELCPEAEVLVTEDAGQARGWARERSEQEGRGIIAVGGDGTVHEVGNGLIGGKAALGVLPVGSGNDFFKMLASPRDLEQALPWFQQASPRYCDVGRVEILHEDDHRSEHHFINGLGIGLEAMVADSARRARLLNGFSRYLVAALWHLATYVPPRMHIHSGPNEIEARQFLVAIGNGCCAGGRFRLTPDACIDDGLLDVCRVDTLSRLRLLRILPTVISGRHGRFAEVQMDQVKEISIRCPAGCMVHADGEMLATDAVEIRVRVRPGVLPVLG
jgi:diacylglycerol kinase (ATP)